MNLENDCARHCCGFIDSAEWCASGQAPEHRGNRGCATFVPGQPTIVMLGRLLIKCRWLHPRARRDLTFFY